MPALPKTKTVTIASGASQSGALALGQGVLIGIIIPAAWTTANLTVLASVDDANFSPVYDDAGNELTITVGGAGRYIALDQRYFVGFGAIKLRSGTSGTPVNQAAERIITLVTKEH